MRRRSLPAAGVVGLLLALGIAVAPAAQAHDELVGTDPADGVTVPTAPAKVTLTFEEPAVAMGTEIEVRSPDGDVVSAGDPELVDATVSQAVAGDLPAGKYSVTWRVTSQDGHAVSGTFAFTAAEAAGGAASESPTAAASSSAAPSASSSAAAPSASASASPSVSPSASAEPDDESTSPVLAVVGVGLLVGIVFGALGWARARRRRSTGGADRP